MVKRAIIFLTLVVAAFGTGFSFTTAYAATKVSSWTFIGSSPYSCGYYRAKINNDTYRGIGRTKNVVYYTGNPCSSGNGLTALPAGHLGASAALRNTNTGYQCGSTGRIYNTGDASILEAKANHLASTNCPKHAGHWYQAYGSGARWDPSLGGYRSSGSISSPTLRFN